MSFSNRSANPTLAASLKNLAHNQNVTSLNPIYTNDFERCSSELTEFIALPDFPGRSTLYANNLQNLSVTIPRCCKDVYLIHGFLSSYS